MRSQQYYMCTINQDPDCKIPINIVKEKLIKYLETNCIRWLICEEEGGVNGKKHLHFNMELKKDIRPDNIKRSIYNITEIKQGKYVINLNGTAKLPYKENWEIHTIAYATKDENYITNIDQTYIVEQIKENQLLTVVENRSLYISKPDFWRKFRIELIHIRQVDYGDSRERFEREWEKSDEIKHMVFERLLEDYTSIWLKTDIISEIISFQEGLVPYEPNMRSLVEKQILLKPGVIQYENVVKARK